MGSIYRIATALFLAALALGNPPSASGQVCDWMTAASFYTHNPQTGERVHQYAPTPKVVHTPDPNVSVYRHQRSTLRVGNSMDQYHKVYRSGVVRPYGEWKYPYRPYSVPFSDWAYGSPFGHLANPPRTNPMLPPTFLTPGYYPGPFYPNPGYGGPGFGGPGYGGPGYGGPGNGGPGYGGPGHGGPGYGGPGHGGPGNGGPAGPTPSGQPNSGVPFPQFR